MTVDQQGPRLPQALARAAAACYNLDESIAKAHRIICDLELLKQQSVELLGHDPPALQTLGVGRGGVPGGSPVASAAAAVSAWAAVKQEAGHSGQAQTWSGFNVATAAAAANREPGRPAAEHAHGLGGAPAARPSTGPADSPAQPQEGQQRQGMHGRAIQPCSRASGTVGRPPLPPVRTGRPAAVAAGPAVPLEVLAGSRKTPIQLTSAAVSPRMASSSLPATSPRTVVTSPKTTSMGRFRLATTASGKVKLTPLQALRRKAAASGAEQPAAESARSAQPAQQQQQHDAGLPRQPAGTEAAEQALAWPQQHEQCPQHPRKPRPQGQQHEQPSLHGSLQPRPQQHVASVPHLAPGPEASAAPAGPAEQLLKRRRKKQRRQRPPLPPQHRKRRREQEKPQPQSQPKQRQQEQHLPFQQHLHGELPPHSHQKEEQQQRQPAAAPPCKQQLQPSSGLQQGQEQQALPGLPAAVAEPCASAEPDQGSSRAGDGSEEDELLEARRQRIRAAPQAKPRQQQSPPEPASLAASGTAASSDGGGSVAASRAASEEPQAAGAEAQAQEAPAGSDSVWALGAGGGPPAGPRATGSPHAQDGSTPNCTRASAMSNAGTSSSSSSSGEDDEEHMPLAKRRRKLQQAKLRVPRTAALATRQGGLAAEPAAKHKQQPKVTLAERQRCEPAACQQQQQQQQEHQEQEVAALGPAAEQNLAAAELAPRQVAPPGTLVEQQQDVAAAAAGAQRPLAAGARELQQPAGGQQPAAGGATLEQQCPGALAAPEERGAAAPEAAAASAAGVGREPPPAQEEAAMQEARLLQVGPAPAEQRQQQQEAQSARAPQRCCSPSLDVEDTGPPMQQPVPPAALSPPDLVVLLDDSSGSSGCSSGSDVEEVVPPQKDAMAQSPAAGTLGDTSAQQAIGQAAHQRAGAGAQASARPPQAAQRLAMAAQQPWAGKPGGPGATGAASKWYAVAVGRRPGLYTRWTECAGQVLGFRGSEYKTFSSQEAARQYLQQRGIDPDVRAAAQAVGAATGAASEAAAAAVQPKGEAADAGAQQQPLQAAGGSDEALPASEEAVHGSRPSSRGPSPSGFAADGEDDSSGGVSEVEGEEHVVEEEEQGGGNGRCSARAAGPATEAAAGATGFHFQDPEAARQFRQSFAAPSPGRKGRLTGIKRRSWAGAAGAAPVPKKRAASPGEKAAQQAWDAFARAWREKNKPSGAEIKRAARDAAAATAAASAARDMRTPMQRLARERAAQQADAARAGAAQQAAARRRAAVAWAPALLGPSPAADDLEARRMHFRHACQRKVAGVSSFVEILRAFNVPTHPSKLKDAYRLAVRMYHPDSNSKEKVWSTEEQKMEAEEVMKVINERKPEDL